MLAVDQRYLAPAPTKPAGTSDFSIHGLQDSLRSRSAKFMTALDDAGIIDALVATLQHDSPFCIAAAAGALGGVDQTPGVGKALLEARRAMPALVSVLEQSPSPGDPEKEMGVYRRYAAVQRLFA
jgi:hypothetical protein